MAEIILGPRDRMKARWFRLTLPIKVRVSKQDGCGCRRYIATGKTWAYCYPHLRAELERMTAEARKNELRAIRKRAI